MDTDTIFAPQIRPCPSRYTDPMAGHLPKFHNPPVVETVLGVQFTPLPKFGAGHLGAFWKALDQREWCNVNEAAALPLQHEIFGEAITVERGFRFSVREDAPVRLQIRNRDEDKMIQLQNGRLHYNWLKKKTKYPSYDVVKPEFDKALGTFVRFADIEDLGPLEWDQWEVTYLNHILQGTVWNKPGDWATLLAPLLGPAATVPTGSLENISATWRYEIGQQRGRLHVELQPGSETGGERRPILVLKLTARGPIEEGRGLDEGLNLGHETIVKAFRALTSPSAHEYWELCHADQ